MLRTYLFILAILALGSACKSERKERVVTPPKVEQVKGLDVVVQMDSMVIGAYASIGLIPVQDSRIIVDLRYTTSNNFMGHILYDTIDRLFLQQDVVERISRCQDLLDSLRPGYRFKIFDGVRPLQVQKEMWDALDSIPAGQRGKFVSNPKYGSVHNFGTAVDLTICDSNGIELDMGAGYDDFRPIAFPSKEVQFLKSGELTLAQYENRKLLRKIMRSQRFYNIPSEWWHFNAFSRLTAESRYEILLDESGNHSKWKSPPLPVIKDEVQDSILQDIPDPE